MVSFDGVCCERRVKLSFCGSIVIYAILVRWCGGGFVLCALWCDGSLSICGCNSDNCSHNIDHTDFRDRNLTPVVIPVLASVAIVIEAAVSLTTDSQIHR